jgi:hypothetical protein
MNIELVKHIQDTILDMMKKVKFSENGHTYQDQETGNWLQGVSSVSSIVPKDWLSAWGAKEAVKALGYSDYEGDTELAVQTMKKIIDLKTPEEFIAMLKEAKGASSRKSKTALVDGKAGHAWLEEYVLAKIRNTELPKNPIGTLERPISQFIEWEKENVDYWILSEARVAYPEKGYAGTMDAMAMMKNGKLSIIDFKFASHISSDYKLQCAGYQACFEPYKIEIDERIIIRLPKTLEIEEWNKEKHKYFMIPNNIEIMILGKNTYGWDRDTFFHALPLKQWVNNEIKNNGI